MQAFRLAHWRLALFVPALAVFALYFPSTDFGFVWDDRSLLVQSPQFRSWASIWSAVTQPFLGFQGYFRPIPLLGLGVEQIFSEGSSFLPHLDAVLLHMFNTTLVALLGVIAAQHLDGRARGALVSGIAAGLFYGLHPAMIESVAWLSCRFELSLTFFCLSALLADRWIKPVMPRVVVVSLLFFLAALCKEMALALALALPMWHLFFERPNQSFRQLLSSYRDQGHLSVYAGIFMLGLLYLVLRHQAMSGLYAPAQPQFVPWTLEHAGMVLKTLGTYFMLTIWPFTALSPLHTYYPPLIWSDPQVLAGGALLILAPVLALLGLRGKRGAWLLLLCFFLALLPVSNVIPLQIGDNYIQERFLYLPMTFAALWVVLQITELARLLSAPRLKSAVPGLIGLFWLALSVLNIQVSLPFWKNDISLWTWGYMREPMSATAQTNLQAAYVNNGLYDKAMEFTAKVAKDNGGKLRYQQIESYLLALSAKGGDAASPLPFLEILLEQLAANKTSIKINLQAAYSNYAWMYLRAGKLQEAEKYYRKALAEQADYPAASYGLAVVYGVQGNSALEAEYSRKWQTFAHPAVRQEWLALYPTTVRTIREKIAHRAVSVANDSSMSQKPLDSSAAVTTR